MRGAGSGLSYLKELIEQHSRIRTFRDQKRRITCDEALSHSGCHELQQRLEVSVDIEQTNRLAVQTQVCPRQDLKELIESAQPARQRDKTICQLSHQGFALMHGPYFIEHCQAGMIRLRGPHSLRYHTNDLTTGLQCGSGHLSHEANAGASVHYSQPASGQLLPQVSRRLLVHLAATQTRSSKHTDSARGVITALCADLQTPVIGNSAIHMRE